MRAVAAIVVVFAAGCGSTKPSLPAACSGGPGVVLRALAAAPGPVTLGDGTRLSECVAGAFDDGETQELGFTLTPAADRLAARRTTAAAVQLGYLIGAVRRGAAHNNGVQAEMVRRVEAVAAGVGDPALLAAVRRGERAGEAGG